MRENNPHEQVSFCFFPSSFLRASDEDGSGLPARFRYCLWVVSVGASDLLRLVAAARLLYVKHSM